MRPTGGIVAAPTTSLPEQLGGPRNWDYRFCWLRDATLTLLALVHAGYTAEACAWRDWLLRAVAGSPAQLQIMYGLAGERRLTELEVPWLPGYEGARPVRIGNGAHGQLQLDVYGEVMDALHQARLAGLAADETGWALQRALLEHLEAVWREPDEGIWEIRGGRRHFTFSKVMAWVAFDRAVKSAETFGLARPGRALAPSCATRSTPTSAATASTRELNAFVQAYGARQLDASLLLLPIVGFLPPEDPRMRGTVDGDRAAPARGRPRAPLRHGRDAVDGLPAGEGAFLACSFWLADAYVMLGRATTRGSCSSACSRLRNDVGLLAEEYDTAGRAPGRQLPASLLASGPGEHGAQPEPKRRPGRPARLPCCDRPHLNAAPVQARQHRARNAVDSAAAAQRPSAAGG